MPYMDDTNQTTGLDTNEAMDILLEPKKLVLCFDGTGNTFSGSNADTNVVKLLNKLDRHAPRQFHYYQTGIGTYDINETSVNKSWFGEMRSSLAMTIDQGIGNTFDAHVMAGYRFLMKFYDTGARIYMFGFSRGAFTAKFLARMVNTVGLLCKGNEEMVPFAYRLYQRYLAGEIEDFNTAQKARHCHHHDDEDGDREHGSAAPMVGGGGDGEYCARGHRLQRAHNEISAFSNTFCRKERVTVMDGDHEDTEDRNIKVYFLGIWDCVNSVAPLERRTPVPVPVKGTARYVRHAVAVDERRVKFKPALLSQDIRGGNEDEDLKEVWFPGCHGDVGGGWPAELENAFDTHPQSMTIWQRIKNFFTSRKPKEPSKDVRADPFQMSDIPLAWMIRELELVGEADKSSAIKFSKALHGFKRQFKKRKEQALKGTIHDSLAFGSGTGFFKVLLWKFMEILPIITRWELEATGWENVRFPLNMGSARDIPPDAVLHESLLWRLKNDPTYCPGNNHGGKLPPCLKHKGGGIATVKRIEETKPDSNDAFGVTKVPEDQDHTTYSFDN